MCFFVSYTRCNMLWFVRFFVYAYVQGLFVYLFVCLYICTRCNMLWTGRHYMYQVYVAEQHSHCEGEGSPHLHFLVHLNLHLNIKARLKVTNQIINKCAKSTAKQSKQHKHRSKHQKPSSKYVNTIVMCYNMLDILHITCGCKCQ